MDAGSAAAFYAGTLLLRKTFEAVAQRSLSSIFSRLHARFRGEHQLQVLEKELESRLQVLSLPVDMCVQYVLHGNTALQGALDMVLLVVSDIVNFQEELEAQSYNESIPKLSQYEAAKRLECFLSRLDSILPYLALAVNAVSLLKKTDPGLSPSRLMEASHLIRSASSRKGIVMHITSKLHKYETCLTLPCWQEKILSCCATLRQITNSSRNTASGFELAIITGESDSVNGKAFLCFRVDEIAAIGPSTVHVLGLGAHDLEAVLLIDIMPPSLRHQSDCSIDNLPTTPLQDANKKIVHYALQCTEDDCEESKEDFEAKDGRANYNGDEKKNDECPENLDIVGSTSRTSKLGVLECALRLCMLQVREEKDHWLLSDERIRMFFADPRYISAPVANVSKVQNGSKNDSTKQSQWKKKSHTPDGGVSKQSARRLSITDTFYDLQLDSPKAGKS